MCSLNESFSGCRAGAEAGVRASASGTDATMPRTEPQHASRHILRTRSHRKSMELYLKGAGGKPHSHKASSGSPRRRFAGRLPGNRGPRMVDQRVQSRFTWRCTTKTSLLYPVANARPSDRLFPVGTHVSVFASSKWVTEFSDTLRK